MAYLTHSTHIPWRKKRPGDHSGAVTIRLVEIRKNLYLSRCHDHPGLRILSKIFFLLCGRSEGRIIQFTQKSYHFPGKGTTTPMFADPCKSLKS
jgi:hypothetical protein